MNSIGYGIKYQDTCIITVLLADVSFSAEAFFGRHPNNSGILDISTPTTNTIPPTIPTKPGTTTTTARNKWVINLSSTPSPKPRRPSWSGEQTLL